VLFDSRQDDEFRNLVGLVDDGFCARDCRRLLDPPVDLGEAPPQFRAQSRLSAGGLAVKYLLVKATYLIAIGVAMFGWLWFIGWIAMHAI
jgi:hypothetical protein